ncbi:MAG: hypothetical protein AB7T49_18110 [Oligoflexales bacterium]
MTTIHLMPLLAIFAILNSCGEEPSNFNVASYDSSGGADLEETPTASSEDQILNEQQTSETDQTATTGEGGDETSSEPDGSGGDQGPAQPVDTKTEDGVREICQNQAVVETMTKTIRFDRPETTCAWNMDGNLSKVQAVVRARREQAQNLDIGSDAVICGVAFDVPQQQIQFDDEIFLLFNNVVLAMSKDYTYALPQHEGLHVYDWASLRNEDYLPDGYSHNYCLGEGDGTGTCVMPYTETTGALKLAFDDSVLHKISSFSDTSQHSFGLVTIGDDNNTDCIHTGLQFQVSVRYVRVTPQ